MIKRIALFLLIALGLAFGLDVFFTHSLTRDDYNKVWWAWQQKGQHYDYAILGNSRPLTSFNTPMLDSIWRKKGINLSLDDAQPSTQYLILKYWLEEKGNHIDTLYLNIDLWGLHKSAIEESKIWCFLPYMKNAVVYHHFAQQYPTNAVLWRYVPFYRYADYNTRIGPFTVANHYLHFAHKPFNHKGDWLKQGSFVKADSSYRVPSYHLADSSTAYQYTERMIQLAQSHNIKIKLFTTPVYHTTYEGVDRNAKVVSNELKSQLLFKYGVTYHDLSVAMGLRQHQQFYDEIHLNTTSVNDFTRLFARTMGIPPRQR